MAFGREARGRGIRIACRGKVGGLFAVVVSGKMEGYMLIMGTDPRKYKRRPGGVARKIKAGGTGVVTAT